MKRYIKLAMVGLMLGGVLTGCSEDAASTKATPHTPVSAEETESNEQDLKQQEQKEYGQWIVDTKELLSNPSTDSLLEQAGFDEGFNMYLNARDFAQEKLANIPEGHYNDKDIQNLFMLYALIEHIQFSRTAHLGENGEAIEAAELADQWEPTPDKMRQAYDYMLQILNDLDVAVNRDGKGETFGVTHQLNGEHVGTLELFWSGNGEE
ncbi:hypothetical protein [Niallia sp. Krafla_26]|uniref:hypothetical protein n=1 Tax=Niallia sp. Krafla_26 TaxID=3064703 RepID=UPI003D163A99